MSRVVTTVLACLLGGLGLLPTSAEARPKPRHAQARAIADLLRQGLPVLLDEGTTIAGDLNLEALVIEGAFVCRRCTLTGGIQARYARFERGIDLSGSTVRGKVDLGSSVFSEPARFGMSESERHPSATTRGCGPIDPIDFAPSTGASFGGDVNFAFASFKDVADFEDVDFCKKTDFTSTRFIAVGRYGAASFGGASIFRATRFEREAFFERGYFAARTDFRNATFRNVADFRHARFAGAVDSPNCEQTVCFLEAVFRGRADFSESVVSTRASFQGASFVGDALFRDAVFDRPVSFESTTVGGRLELAGARLSGSAQFLSLSANELSLHETTFVLPFRLDAERLQARSIVANVDQIELVPEDENKKPLLRTLEASAKARGDLGLANDAHFRLQELATYDDWPPRKVADYVLYRWVAGYLVRPLYPLTWLLVIVFLATVLRMFYRTAKDWAGTRRPFRPSSTGGDQPPQESADNKAETAHQPPGTSADNEAGTPKPPPGKSADSDARTLERPAGRGGSLPGRFVTALALTLTGREEPSPLRRTELFVYVFLLACFGIALANTNPTLRDMIDAVT